MSKTYSPGDGSLIIGGSIIKFDSVTIAKNEPKNFMTEGTQGEVTRTKNLSTLGTITVVLPQSSSDNAILSAKAIANGIESILFKDNLGASLATMPEGVFTELPDSEFAKEHGDRSWEFQGSMPIYIIGGN
jgi:hypothetical protein